MGAKDSKLVEKMAQRKERGEELLPEQLVPNGCVRSGFWLVPENICQGLFSPFFTVLLPVMTFPRPHYVTNDAPSCRQPPYSLPDGFVVNWTARAWSLTTAGLERLRSTLWKPKRCPQITTWQCTIDWLAPADFSRFGNNSGGFINDFMASSTLVFEQDATLEGIKVCCVLLPLWNWN